MLAPADYESWYRTPRGSWIARREFELLWHLVPMPANASLLDVGCGTGHFSRRYAAAGLVVTGLDPDRAALDYARSLSDQIHYCEGDALRLPFADHSFDYCAAVTSLCFIADPARALAEMWRVARRAVVLGLLNRRSLLQRRKAGKGAYVGARWDDTATVHDWVAGLQPPARLRLGSAIIVPGGGPLARLIEGVAPQQPLWGGFLAAALTRS